MLNNIFANIVTMSIAAGICILLFFGLRIVTKKLFSSTWHYYIWLAVICVLIIPFKFDIPNISKMNLDFIPADTVEKDTNESDSDLSEQHTGAISGHNGEINIRTSITPLIQKLPVIWLCGVILTIIYRMTVYFRFALSVKRMSRVCAVEVTPYKSIKIKKANIKTPFLMGICNPVIYLPDIEWDDTELEMVLTHETTHLKRKDILYKMLMQAVLCIHWYNPLVYLMNRDMQKYCELSCDEKAISRMDGEKRKVYMKTILNLIVKTSPVQSNMTTAMGASKSETEKRIRAIIKYRNHSRFIKYVSVFTAVIFLTTGIATASQINVVKPDKNAIDQNKAYEEDAENFNAGINTPVKNSADKVTVNEQSPATDNTSDEANLKLYKITSKFNSKWDSYEHRYTLCETFTSWSEAQNYFAETYSIKTEVLTQNIIPKSKHWEPMNFGTYKLSSGFSFKGLGICVEANQETVYYILMDISAFKIFEPDKSDETQLLSEFDSGFGITIQQTVSQGAETTLSSALNAIVKDKWGGQNEHFVSKNNIITLK